MVLGLLVAWVLVRYDFPLKRLFDALVDLPFALPTAVAGLVYATLYVAERLARAVPGAARASRRRTRGSAIVLVLVFTGFPFVVRTVQPVLESLDAEMEEAAAIARGDRAGRRSAACSCRTLMPALLTGFALAFARALGEYGSVVFVSGNMPFETEIAPVLIVARLEEFAYAEATAIAVVLLARLVRCCWSLINLLERWSKRHAAERRHERPPATAGPAAAAGPCAGSAGR